MLKGSIKKIYIKNLSGFCVYSSLIATKVLIFLKKNGYVVCNDIKEADDIIINCCGLFEENRKYTLSLVDDFSYKYKNKRIILLGCIMDLKRYDLKNVIIVENHKLDKLNGIFSISGDIAKINTGIIDEKCKSQNITDRNFYILILSTGCKNNCAYCLYSYYRGRLQSRKIEEILRDFKDGIQKGYKDFFAYADNVQWFGFDNNENFRQLLEKMEKIDSDFSLNIENFHPQFLIEQLDSLIPYFKKGIIKFLDVPIQSGSDEVLWRMNRRYKIEDVIKAVKKIKGICPNLIISTDIIYCFPGETAEDFSKSINISRFFDYATFHEFDVNSVSSKIISEITQQEKDFRRKFVEEKEKSFLRTRRPFC